MAVNLWISAASVDAQDAIDDNTDNVHCIEQW